MTTLSTPSSPLPSPSPHPSIPPTPSPNAAPIAGSIDPSTALHLLSLPPLLHPISPHLAALHLARLQLLLSVSTVSGGVLEWWCNSCGGLREGLGGAARGRRRRNKGQVMGVPSTRLESIGTGTGGTGIGTTVMTDIDGVKPNGLGGISTAAAGSSSNSTSTSNTNSNPPGLAATRTTRKPPNCTICGASFKRPKPDPAALALFPPARRARRSKAAYSGAGVGTGSGLPAEDAKDVEGLKGAKHVEGVTAAEDVKGVKRETSSGVVKTAKGVSGGDAPTSRLDLDPGSASSTTSRPSNPTPGADPAATAPPPPPTSSDSSAPSLALPSGSTPRPLLLSTPRLAHIPTADPSPPTYPPPPSLTGVKRPASPRTARGGAGGAGAPGAAGAGAGGRGAGAGAGPAPGKKRKKSGLAKLLAESKARDEGASGVDGVLDR